MNTNERHEDIEDHATRSQLELMREQGIKITDLLSTRARTPSIAGRAWVDVTRNWVVVILSDVPRIAAFMRDIGCSEYLLRVKYHGLSIYERPPS